ncbi:DNA repair protein [Sulfitobacter sp. D35]|uniref:DNA repair protein n=1 Tax=Sulfitobacter sp. D35 TaxID=3083252 RepID=UPI00296F45FF|nr:DNA repair protein [Sulfitobacter sp. D35]MDW4499736.1 DNA repair protein [Sulfitobacter sp. D35]
MHAFHTLSRQAQVCLNWLSIFLISLGAAAGLAWTALSAFGLLPWLNLDIAIGAIPAAQAGMVVQIGLTALMVMMASALPASTRVLTLENSHRRFHMQMEDVARAYYTAHAADRQGAFQLASEFDAVRERIVHLRDHPELQGLEPSILEIAAQMSHLSRDLADTYSDENVARARTFLQQRQEEVDLFRQRIDHAKGVLMELKGWTQKVELDEAVAGSQLDTLRAELAEILPELGEINPDPTPEPPRHLGIVRHAAE